jgi:hypothetical protein
MVVPMPVLMAPAHVLYTSLSLTASFHVWVARGESYPCAGADGNGISAPVLPAGAAR